ncbi:MAG: hypothetical protein WCH85_06405 [Methanomicrobiales archaeon]
MNNDAYDPFRKMDALADHLFARMARNSETGTAGYCFPLALQEMDPYAEPGEYADPIPSHSVSEPIPEVHQIENEVIVVVELPGVTRESVHLAVVRDRLIVDADGGDCQYHTEAVIPPVDPDTLQISMKNGVLEVKFRNSGSVLVQ